ncbi:MAG: hypothetical protein OXN25_22290 [Candidatus Poribacteria bacterium]|nr:hypothetical protein [Candidatus Poribacteria bacterium]
MLLTFEGIDGSGKTTISRMVYEKLKYRIPQIQYHEKSSTDFDHPYIRDQVSKLREVLWPPNLGEQKHNVFGDYYWLFLMAAWFSIQSVRLKSDRSQRNLILFDSWYYRFVAKFINKGFDKEWLFSIFDATDEPDLVVMLDIDPQLAWKRRSKFKNIEMGKWDGFSGDDFESYCKYQAQIRQTLLQFAKERRWFVVYHTDGTTADEMSHLIFEYILSRHPNS